MFSLFVYLNLKIQIWRSRWREIVAPFDSKSYAGLEYGVYIGSTWSTRLLSAQPSPVTVLLSCGLVGSEANIPPLFAPRSIIKRRRSCKAVRSTASPKGVSAADTGPHLPLPVSCSDRSIILSIALHKSIHACTGWDTDAAPCFYYKFSPWVTTNGSISCHMISHLIIIGSLCRDPIHHAVCSNAMGRLSIPNTTLPSKTWLCTE